MAARCITNSGPLLREARDPPPRVLPSLELVVLRDELIDPGFASGRAILGDGVPGGADLAPGAPNLA